MCYFSELQNSWLFSGSDYGHMEYVNRGGIANLNAGDQGLAWNNMDIIGKIRVKNFILDQDLRVKKLGRGHILGAYCRFWQNEQGELDRWLKWGQAG